MNIALPQMCESYLPIEGLWIVTFIRGSGGGSITGTAVFRDELVLGGDNERCYIGEYRTTDAAIEGKIDLPLHTQIKEPSCFFGNVQEPVVSFSLKREREGIFGYIGDAEIQNAVDVCRSFTIALQRAYRLD
ncbi:hypothetical protein [Wenzhouxiangella sp. XN24]|uniref:hypothetical protein n=1 Tax=Wenzhouxiangella sp. XN24 TaxID=2713569 RepID=UPI0013EAD840|nr:hypothetical protein [Wenzhouxiangella sp. XN24]NGX16151.1 hypothetical protein [Wenzhouxiangella sp. XN24]